MNCTACGGTGCEECQDTGRIEITQCPLEIITPDIWEVIELAQLYEKGLPPVAGGALDQANIFVDACRMIWSEEKVWKNKLGIFT
jgi:NADPH-dependent 7-cyano-7-deazaguanine reductase QueF-like protein